MQNASTLTKIADSIAGLFANDTSGNLLGYQIKNGKPVYQSVKDALKHTMIIGGEGSGRRTALLDKAAVAIEHGESLIYINGSQDRSIALYENLYSIAAASGRQASVFLLNFSSIEDTRELMGNTFNPLSYMSAEDAIEWLSAIFGGKQYFSSLVPALVFGHLVGNWTLDIRHVIESLAWDRLVALSVDSRINDKNRATLKVLVDQLTENDAHAKYQQFVAEATIKSKVFTETYGHIFSSDANSHAYEVTLNHLRKSGHVVVINLPDPLQSEGTGNLDLIGSAVSAALKLAISNLITPYDGDDILATIIADHFNAYLDDSWASILPQCRNYGIQVILSDNTVDAHSPNREKWAALAANCGTKVMLRSEDAATVNHFIGRTLSPFGLDNPFRNTDLLQLNAGQSLVMIMNNTYKLNLPFRHIELIDEVVINKARRLEFKMIFAGCDKPRFADDDRDNDGITTGSDTVAVSND